MSTCSLSSPCFTRPGFSFLALIACFGTSPVAAQVSAEDAGRWRADLGELVVQLSERHVDLHHALSRESFVEATEDLYERIPAMELHEILVGFSQLVAMVGDGHTSLDPADQRGMEFGYLPLRLWGFDDGIYVIAAFEEYESLLGRRLRQIDGTAIEEVIQRVGSTISADNPMEQEYTAPFLLNRPELLPALGITEAAKQAKFSFVDGSEVTLAAIGVSAFDRGPWITANPLYEGGSPARMRLNYLFATPVMIEHLGKYYWFSYLEESAALFFQFNTCWDQGRANPLDKVLEDFFQFLDEHPVERVIIDMRQNPGGEPMTAAPLIEGLAARKRLGEEGRLFVLTGRRTFSAAVTNTADLRRLAGARLVGEAPRGKPNHPGEGRDIVLEQTGVVAAVSTQFVERDPDLGEALYLPVDIPVVCTWEAFEEARDSGLEAALDAELGTRR